MAKSQAIETAAATATVFDVVADDAKKLVNELRDMYCVRRAKGDWAVVVVPVTKPKSGAARKPVFAEKGYEKALECANAEIVRIKGLVRYSEPTSLARLVSMLGAKESGAIPQVRYGVIAIDAEYPRDRALLLKGLSFLFRAHVVGSNELSAIRKVL